MRTAIPALTLAAALTLTACGTTDSTTTASSTASTKTSASTTAASALTLTDGWAKAAPAGGMSAAFGVLKNTSDHDVTITGVTSPASSMLQLHVTEKDAAGNMVMKEAADGFTVKAGQSLTLAPGANHIMFMKLDTALLAGSTVDLTVKLADGGSQTLTVPIREFTGAKETYAPTSGMSGTHDMGSMTPTTSAH